MDSSATPAAGSSPADAQGTEPQATLSASGIGKSFSGVAALQGVDLELWRGEVHALMGENGAGKSTLMKVLAGVHSDYEGEVRVDGASVRFASPGQAEAAGIAIIHQELNLVPELTVAENIFLGREPRVARLMVDRRRMARDARRLLARLGIALDPGAKVGGLRVGEQQLVEIAKALSMSARILIMDEPTSALSPAECRQLFGIIESLAAEGVAIVYISHRLDEVMRLATRVTVLRDGRHVASGPIADFSEERIIAAMVGRELLEGAPPGRDAAGPVLLSVRGLTLDVPVGRRWKRVVDGVDFDVRAGEILGIGGLLGSGRTEILQAVFGATRGRRGGEIRVDGVPVSIADPRDARRLGLAFVTEDRKAEGLHLHEPLGDNVALPSVGRLSRFGLRAFRPEAAMARRVVADLGVRCAGIGQAAGTLSGGNQQKVVIGKWLATRPRVLLLDEPTRGIDVGAKREIYDLVFRLAADGMAIVLVSSELPELLFLASRILVMSEGRQTGVLEKAEASEETVMRLAAPRSGPAAA